MYVNIYLCVLRADGVAGTGLVDMVDLWISSTIGVAKLLDRIDQDFTVTCLNRGPTFAFRRSTLGICLGGQHSFEHSVLFREDLHVLPAHTVAK